MRESFFTKLQRLCLILARKTPGNHVNELQQILIKKQKDEEDADR